MQLVLDVTYKLECVPGNLLQYFELKVLQADKLTQHEDVTGQEIQRLISNYQKDFRERKKGEYLTARSTQLDELWALFSKTNDDIQRDLFRLSARQVKDRYNSTPSWF